MRTLLFFSLLLSSFAFGQSVKALNKKLVADLLMAEKEQDSVYRLFFQERMALEKIREIRENEISNIAGGEDVLREITNSIVSSLNTLSLLEINTKDVFPAGFNPDTSLLTKSPTWKQYEDALNKTMVFHYVFLEFYFSKEDKLSDRNILIQSILEDYRASVKKNESGFLDQQIYKRQLSELGLHLDTLTQKYRARISELEPKATLLAKKVKDARENYRLNGPGGFPPSYQVCFPSVHPEMPGRMSDRLGEREVVSLLQEPAPEVMLVTDESAQYPDGRAAMLVYLEKNLVYPASARDEHISGKVFVRFVVSKTGQISQVKVLKGIENCPECSEEAIRLVSAMPRWIPGKNKGKAVNMYYNLPVTFKLNDK